LSGSRNAFRLQRQTSRSQDRRISSKVEEVVPVFPHPEGGTHPPEAFFVSHLQAQVLVDGFPDDVAVGSAPEGGKISDASLSSAVRYICVHTS
jgi:hypothetical protein